MQIHLLNYSISRDCERFPSTVSTPIRRRERINKSEKEHKKTRDFRPFLHSHTHVEYGILIWKNIIKMIILLLNQMLTGHMERMAENRFLLLIPNQTFISIHNSLFLFLVIFKDGLHIFLRIFDPRRAHISFEHVREGSK